MDKLKMQTENIVDENIEFIGKKFPNCIVEAKDEAGKVTKMVDFDLLKQELSKVVVDGDKERYQMTWPDKKQAILTANSPIAKTLRPCKEKSVDFDNTKNIYIEGDNLDVLKLLRETYLGKVKMIYIDPPYNTGNDFVYNDDFATDTEEYLERSNQVDEEGNRMVANNESNGRFHTDWLNMIYPRLKVAKDLLTDDGIIFVSIDDNEIDNLSKMMSEIYGNQNFICKFIWEKTVNPNSTFNNVGIVHEYVLCYSKSLTKLKALELNEKELADYTGHDDFESERGPYKLVGLNKTGTVNDLRPNLMYDITAPDGSIIKPNPRWRWSKEKFDNGIKNDRVVFKSFGDKWSVYYKQYLFEDTEGNKIERGSLIKTIISDCGRTTNGSLEISEIMGKGVFDFPKPVALISRLIEIASSNNDIIMDFFSGSATTAHAVLKVNSMHETKRKFLLVQLPEVCSNEKYDTICDIGEERIRRAGKKIKEENPMLTQTFDTGFRVFKLDSSNMKDTYYKPSEYNINLLDALDENIKPDRTPEDLLFQVMLDLGLMLDSKIEEKNINGKKVFIVGEYNDMVKPDLICCFDSNVDNNTVTEIAKMQPRFAVFRDSSMAKDSVAVNFDQLFETYSPSTTRKVL